MSGNAIATRPAVAAYVLAVLADVMGVEISELDDIDPAEPLALSSLQNMSIVARLDDNVGDIPLTLLFDRPSLKAIVDYLITERLPDVDRFLRG